MLVLPERRHGRGAVGAAQARVHQGEEREGGGVWDEARGEKRGGMGLEREGKAGDACMARGVGRIIEC